MNAPLRPGPRGIDAELERYQISSRAEIVSVLRAVAASRAMVTIGFNQGMDFIVTSLLGVDPDADALVFDFGADARSNARLLQAERLNVSTVLDRIKVQFASPGAVEVEFEGAPGLALPLPELLLRLQRREHYRVRTPLTRPLVASVPHPQEPGKRAQLRILNLSCGGIAVVSAGEAVTLEPGTVLHDCRIELPEFGTVNTALEVRNAGSVEERGGKRTQRCGCRFLDVAPATLTLLQRYITRLERANAALR